MKSHKRKVSRRKMSLGIQPIESAKTWLINMITIKLKEKLAVAKLFHASLPAEGFSSNGEPSNKPNFKSHSLRDFADS